MFGSVVQRFATLVVASVSAVAAEYVIYKVTGDGIAGYVSVGGVLYAVNKSGTVISSDSRETIDAATASRVAAAWRNRK